MSRATAASPSLHIEWAPGRVRAIDVADGRSAEGESPSQIASALPAHRHILVGVERGRIFLRTVRLPKAAPEDLRRIVAVQMAQSFPLPADQLAFDFVQTEDRNADGYLTLVAAVRADDLRQIHAEFRDAGMTVVRVLPVALGAPAVAASAGAAAAALVIEETSAGLALDVVQEGVVRASRVAPPGSDPLTEARRTLAAAEARDLPLVFVGQGARDSLHGALHGTAGALTLLHEAPTSFAFALEEERVQLAKKRIATRTRLAVLLAASALLLVTLVWADRSDARTALQRGEGSWARQLGKLRSIRSTELNRAQRASTVQTALKQAFEPAQPVSDITAAVGDALPQGTWLTGLSVERGKPVTIRGTGYAADSVSRFVDALGKSTRFRDVHLVFANGARIDKTPVVQFSITAVAVGNLPMPTPPKSRSAGARRTTTGSTSSSTTTTAGTTGSSSSSTGSTL